MLCYYPRMEKPLIGITANTLVEGVKESGRRGDFENAVPQAYVDAVEEAGGTPLIIPLVAQRTTALRILSCLDGLLLTGGGDIDPGLFGQEPHPKLGVVDVAKDRLESSLLSEALGADIPILGICRGMQILNVAAGGTLIQDIPSSSPTRIQHAQHATAAAPSHTLCIKKGSRLASIVGTTKLRVNSYHHQAVDRVARGFVISATASDGITEAIESKSRRFVLGVQFHPEMIFRDFPSCFAIFKAFVQESAVCGKGKA